MPSRFSSSYLVISTSSLQPLRMDLTFSTSINNKSLDSLLGFGKGTQPFSILSLPMIARTFDIEL